MVKSRVLALAGLDKEQGMDILYGDRPLPAFVGGPRTCRVVETERGLIGLDWSDLKIAALYESPVELTVLDPKAEIPVESVEWAAWLPPVETCTAAEAVAPLPVDQADIWEVGENEAPQRLQKGEPIAYDNPARTHPERKAQSRERQRRAALESPVDDLREFLSYETGATVKLVCRGEAGDAGALSQEFFDQPGVTIIAMKGSSLADTDREAELVRLLQNLVAASLTGSDLRIRVISEDHMNDRRELFQIDEVREWMQHFFIRKVPEAIALLDTESFCLVLLGCNPVQRHLSVTGPGPNRTNTTARLSIDWKLACGIAGVDWETGGRLSEAV